MIQFEFLLAPNFCLSVIITDLIMNELYCKVQNVVSNIKMKTHQEECGV